MSFCVSCGGTLPPEGKFCPSCGAGAGTGSPRAVQTIERTGKRFKAAQAGAVFVLIVAVVLFIAGDMMLGALVGVLGLAVYIAARAGAWWEHG